MATTFRTTPLILAIITLSMFSAGDMSVFSFLFGIVFTVFSVFVYLYYWQPFSLELAQKSLKHQCLRWVSTANDLYCRLIDRMYWSKGAPYSWYYWKILPPNDNDSFTHYVYKGQRYMCIHRWRMFRPFFDQSFTLYVGNPPTSNIDQTAIFVNKLVPKIEYINVSLSNEIACPIRLTQVVILQLLGPTYQQPIDLYALMAPDDQSTNMGLTFCIYIKYLDGSSANVKIENGTTWIDTLVESQCGSSIDDNDDDDDDDDDDQQ
jgi:hypothetical protein